MFECRPVSTNVMRQSWMSLECSSTLRPPSLKREVVRHALVVLEEILADQVAAVPQAQNEVLVAEVRVVAHQVPEDRPVADVDERLGNRVGMFAQTRAEATAEKDNLHQPACAVDAVSILHTEPGQTRHPPAHFLASPCHLLQQPRLYQAWSPRAPAIPCSDRTPPAHPASRASRPTGSATITSHARTRRVGAPGRAEQPSLAKTRFALRAEVAEASVAIEAIEHRRDRQDRLRQSTRRAVAKRCQPSCGIRDTRHWPTA